VPYEDVITIRAIDETKAAVTSAMANMRALNAATAAASKQGVVGTPAQKKGLTEWIHKNQLGLRMIGHDAQMVGQSIFRWITVPMGVVSIVTAKMAYDFNTAMTKVQALTGTSVRMMQDYNEAVLDLSKSTGVAPTEVAEGLYFIASSGFKGAEALAILEQSTKLAATGMGDMMFMGQTLTSAMTAWGDGTLSAAAAADTLVAAVREGKAEPDEFSRSLGRVIPVAAQVGITFQEVGAAIAAMTNIGLSARISTFALRTLLTSFLKPQKPLIEGLKEVGLTVKDVVKQMTTDGFLPAMETIYEATGGSAEKITQMFTQNAGTAFLALFRSADKTKKIFDELINSEGSAAKAFNVAMQSPAAQFRIAVANLKAGAIELGNKLLPVFTKIVGFIGKMVDGFNGLSDSTQAWIGKLLVATSAFGILLTLFGKAATVLTSLGAGVRMLQGKATGPGILAPEKVAAAGATAAEAGALGTITGVTASNTAARSANAAAAMAQFRASAGVAMALQTETAVLTASEAATFRLASAQMVYEDALVAQTAARARQAAAIAVESDAIAAYGVLQAQANVAARASVAAQNELAAATARLAGVQTEQSVAYLAGLEAQATAAATRATAAQAALAADGQAAVARSAATHAVAAADTELLVANQAVVASQAEVTAATTGATVALNAEAGALYRAEAAATSGGLATGFRAIGVAIKGMVASIGASIAAHPIGWIIGTAAALTAALVVFQKLSEKTAATGEEMSNTIDAVTKDTSGKLREWATTALGGVLNVRAGKISWTPTVDLHMPNISGLVKWTKTAGVEERKRLRMEANQTKIEYAKSAAQVALWGAQAADKAMEKMMAGRHGVDPRTTTAYKNLEATRKAMDAEYDRLIKSAEDYEAKRLLIEKRWKPRIIEAQIKDMGNAIEKYQGQLKKIRALPEAKRQTVEVILKEQQIIDKIRDIKKRRDDLTRKNWVILARLDAQQVQNRIDTIKNALQRLSKPRYPVKVRIEKQNLEKEADQLQIKLRKLGRGANSAKPEVKLQMQTITEDLAKVRDRLKKIDAQNPKPKLSVEQKALKRALTAAEKRLEELNAYVAEPIVRVNDQATEEARAIKSTLDALFDTAIVQTITVNKVNAGEEPVALGGIFNLTKATRFLAGEAGHEIAAFFPMNNPGKNARMLAALTKQLGIAPPGAKTSTFPIGLNTESRSSNGSRESRTVEIHHTKVDVLVPAGTTIVGTAKEVSNILAPHIDKVLQRNQERLIRRGR